MVSDTTPIPILLYHAISDDPPPQLRRWTVSPRAFAAHVSLLRASGRVPLTVAALVAARRAEAPLPLRPVVVTFDDGYADTLEAVRLLAGNGIVSTVYVTVGAIGERGMLSREMLQQLTTLDGAAEVGSHGITHRRLDELERSEIDVEVRDSRRRLQELTGTPVDTFAYPHGCHDARVLAAVRNAGYAGAVAVRNALSHRRDDVHALARVTIDATTTEAEVAAILEGRFRIASPGEQLRTRGYRRLRRLRRRWLRLASSAR